MHKRQIVKIKIKTCFKHVDEVAKLSQVMVNLN
jgi:hypothetical protein